MGCDGMDAARSQSVPEEKRRKRKNKGTMQKMGEIGGGSEIGHGARM